MPDDQLHTDFVSEPGADGRHVTYCRICEAICGMVADVKDGKIIRLAPDKANPHSRGHVCVKGTSFADVTYDVDRVLQPLKHTGGPGEFQPVSWDEALDDIAARLKIILEEHGPSAFASVYGNPSAFGVASLMGPTTFQSAIGAYKTFSPHSEDTAAPLLALNLLFGKSSYTFPDLPACDFLLIFGSNPLVSHGSLIIAPRIKEDLDAIAQRGRVVVVDPRRTETARKFEHVPINPNGDAWLLAGLINEIVRAGKSDEAFLRQYTSGWNELREALAHISLDEAAARCGVAAERITQLALDFAAAPRAAAMGRTGICRGQFPTLANVLLNVLNIVAGKFHKEGCFGFGYGASDSGKMLEAAGMAGRDVNASRVSDLPSFAGSLPSVTLYDEITVPGDGKVRALFVTGGNPVMSMPGGARLPEAFATLDLMVAFDIYPSETAIHAHYILPGPTFLERADAPFLFFGHMVRPYVQYSPAVIPPLGDVRSEWEVLKSIAQRLGKAEPFGNIDPMDMVDGILQTGPEGPNGGDGAIGASLDLLKKHPHGLMLNRTRWSFALEDRIGHADGKIHLFEPLIQSEIARLIKHPAARPEQLRLFSMRKLKSINSWMHNVDRLSRSDTPTLLIHPNDAAKRGIVDGTNVCVSTEWGAVNVIAEVTDDVIEGAVTYPHGWGHAGLWHKANAKAGANINAIAPRSADAVEQISGMSFLDGFPVDVTALKA